MTAYPDYFVANSPEVVQALMRVAALTANANEQAEVIDMAATAFAAGVTRDGIRAISRIYASGRLTADDLRKLGEDIDTSPAMLSIAKQAHTQAQAERDAELGRWRWPDNLDFVVYPDEANEPGRERYAIILDERYATIRRYGSNRTGPAVSVEERAFRAWLAAHPEPKPWHEVKPGEAWVLTIDGTEEAATVGWAMPNEARFYCGGAEFELTDPGITAGYRIWPEEAS